MILERAPEGPGVLGADRAPVGPGVAVHGEDGVVPHHEAPARVDVRRSPSASTPPSPPSSAASRRTDAISSPPRRTAQNSPSWPGAPPPGRCAGASRNPPRAQGVVGRVAARAVEQGRRGPVEPRHLRLEPVPPPGPRRRLVGDEPRELVAREDDELGRRARPGQDLAGPPVRHRVGPTGHARAAVAREHAPHRVAPGPDRRRRIVRRGAARGGAARGCGRTMAARTSFHDALRRADSAGPVACAGVDPSAALLRHRSPTYDAEGALAFGRALLGAARGRLRVVEFQAARFGAGGCRSLARLLAEAREAGEGSPTPSAAPSPRAPRPAGGPGSAWGRRCGSMRSPSRPVSDSARSSHCSPSPPSTGACALVVGRLSNPEGGAPRGAGRSAGPVEEPRRPRAAGSPLRRRDRGRRRCAGPRPDGGAPRPAPDPLAGRGPAGRDRGRPARPRAGPRPRGAQLPPRQRRARTRDPSAPRSHSERRTRASRSPSPEEDGRYSTCAGPRWATSATPSRPCSGATPRTPRLR